MTRRNTGPTAEQRDAVYARAGFRCERCGDGSEFSVHHRRPRGMGGTRRIDTNSPANLLLLCGCGTTGCHHEVESDRAAAISLGLLVSQHHDPAAIPVRLARGWTYLTTDGRYADSYEESA